MGNEYATQVATLVDGVHDEPYLYVEYADRYAYGDFNGDGLKDAAVIVTESGGGTGNWYVRGKTGRHFHEEIHHRRFGA